MKSFKVCILGDFAVGKTSLVRRFVDQQFSERYLTTVGVKIDTKELELAAGRAKLVVWDIAGADELDALRSNYVRGAAGFLVVADLTRADTLTTAKKLIDEVAGQFGPMPCCLLANKLDLEDEREIDDMDMTAPADIPIFSTSAKTGEQVERAFEKLGQLICEPGRSAG
ncbi:MAG: Rab family GTPase [Pseudomonadota bacterium]